MPVYPCEKCNAPVDPTSEAFCRNCSDKQPFSCSRCNKRMANHDIFQLEKLQVKRPLLCLQCGEAGEVVKCGLCKLSLVRSTGRSLSTAPGAKVYHVDCYNKQMKTVDMIGKMVPIMAILGLAMGYLIGKTWGSGNQLAGVIGAPVFAIACAAMTLATKGFFTPK